MNHVRSGGLILGGPVAALLLSAGCVFAQEPTARDGAITGRVLEAEGRAPVGQVDVQLVGTGRRTVTDGRGEFRFDSVPAGEQRLRVRHLGFRSRELTVDVPPGELLGVTIRLDPEPVALDPLDVKVESELRLRRLEDEGFYYRRELDFGHFFGPQYLTRWSGLRMGDVIRRTPGLSAGRTGLRNRRCHRRSGGFNVYVDGIPWEGGVPNWPLTEVAAMEIYRGPSQTVGTAYPPGPCGLILIWTWRGPNPLAGDLGEEYGCPASFRGLRRHAC